jgi:purine-nucleoside phosphorylase
MRSSADFLAEAVQEWDERGWPRPQVLAVAGSGLAVDLGEPLVPRTPLQEILPFEVHSVIGHPHSFEIVSPLPGRPVLYLRGRIHAYQGYDGHQVAFVTRLARLLGAKTLLQTNAAGGFNPEYQPGDLVLIKDHLNLSGSNPLVGTLPPSWGLQFPSMENAYSPALRQLAKARAEELGIHLHEGVYASLLGPSYETPAEVRFFRTVGADLGGMSTVQEVIAGRHMGMRCLCFSLVTNLASGVSPEPLNHEEVLEASKAAAGKVQALLGALLREEALYLEGDG